MFSSALAVSGKSFSRGFPGNPDLLRSCDQPSRKEDIPERRCAPLFGYQTIETQTTTGNWSFPRNLGLGGQHQGPGASRDGGAAVGWGWRTTLVSWKETSHSPDTSLDCLARQTGSEALEGGSPLVWTAVLSTEARTFCQILKRNFRVEAGHSWRSLFFPMWLWSVFI